MEYYKALTPQGLGPYEAKTQFPLPTRKPDGTWKPGFWVTVEGPLQMCVNGFHVFARGKHQRWVKPILASASIAFARRERRRVFAVQVAKGCDRKRDRTKVCVRTMRLTREILHGSNEWIALGLPGYRQEWL